MAENTQRSAIEPANRAVARVLLGFLNKAIQSEKGLLIGDDESYLHDFRVAFRSLRSNLKQTSSIFPQKFIARCLSTLAWLSRMTSVKRDIDVTLAALKRYQLLLPEHLRPGLQPLIVHLVQQQGLQQTALEKLIKSSRYRRFIHFFRRYLQLVDHRATRKVGSQSTIISVTNAAIWRAFRRLSKYRKEDLAKLTVEELHNLRKSAKKLRYLFDAYKYLYPVEYVHTLLRKLKSLQEVLGEIIDAHVLTQLLVQWENDQTRQNPMSYAIQEGLIALKELLHDQTEKPLKQFQAAYKTFTSKSLRRDVVKLVKLKGSHHKLSG